MKAVAIDDEPLALAIIENFTKRLGGIEIQTFANPVVGMEHIKNTLPDLVFLDIQMNEVSGLELAKELPIGTLLVFTTAHANYALEGFELNAMDFLHKPFSYERFMKTADKARHIIMLRQSLTHSSALENNITVKVEYKNTSVNLAMIRYIEAMDNYVKIHMVDGGIIMPQISMKGIMELLPNGDFIRIHRSWVVNRSRIVSFSSKELIVKGAQPTKLSVGRSYAKELLERMSKS